MSNEILNIAVLGAGAMGSLFGGLLAERGQQVTLLDVNEPHLQTVRTQGLRLNTDAGGIRNIRVAAACRPDEARTVPDLLMVFTKSLHTVGALKSASHLIGPETLVMTLQNGLGNVEALAPVVSLTQILVGMTTWPADLIRPGEVHSHGEGMVSTMFADGTQRPTLNPVVAALESAGLNCRVDNAVWKAIWEKVAFNTALNSLCTVTGCTVDQIGASPEGLKMAMDVASEVVTVAHSQNVQADLTHVKSTMIHAITHHCGHKPSMLQDLLAGRRTEIDALNGAVVEYAKQSNLATPHTAMLLHLVRLMEAQHGAH